MREGDNLDKKYKNLYHQYEKNLQIFLYTFLPLASALWHFVKTVEIIIISSVAAREYPVSPRIYIFIKSSLFFSIYSAKFFFELFLQIVLLIVV